jgi:hypothetical protein
MRGIAILVFTVFISVAGQSQELSTAELISLTSLTPQKFEQAINKKGYQKADMTDRGDAVVHVFNPKPKKAEEVKVKRYAEKYQQGEEQFLVYATSSLTENNTIREKLRKEGFFCPVDSVIYNGREILFQKKNMVVAAACLVNPVDTIYSFRFQYKNLPAPARVNFADDLLQFTSHQHLVTMFGAANVTKDQYYFSDNEINACTVLFPNTNRQAIFIWNDEMNLSDLGSIVIGGSVRGGDQAATEMLQVSENAWMLRNGIRPNMKLKDLLELNGKDFTIYGKESDYFMKADAAAEKGEIDFKEIAVIMGCLNCSSSYLLNKEKLSAEIALDNNLSMHVLMLILYPEDNSAKAEVKTK